MVWRTASSKQSTLRTVRVAVRNKAGKSHHIRHTWPHRWSHRSIDKLHENKFFSLLRLKMMPTNESLFLWKNKLYHKEKRVQRIRIADVVRMIGYVGMGM